MKVNDTPFGRIIADKSVPNETIYLIPSVSRTRYENLMTGEVKEVLEWNPKAAGIITNVKP
jgi:hypothetical protein